MRNFGCYYCGVLDRPCFGISHPTSFECPLNYHVPSYVNHLLTSAIVRPYVLKSLSGSTGAHSLIHPSKTQDEIRLRLRHLSSPTQRIQDRENTESYDCKPGHIGPRHDTSTLEAKQDGEESETERPRRQQLASQSDRRS